VSVKKRVETEEKTLLHTYIPKKTYENLADMTMKKLPDIVIFQHKKKAEIHFVCNDNEIFAFDGKNCKHIKKIVVIDQKYLDILPIFVGAPKTIQPDGTIQVSFDYSAFRISYFVLVMYAICGKPNVDHMRFYFSALDISGILDFLYVLNFFKYENIMNKILSLFDDILVKDPYGSAVISVLTIKHLEQIKSRSMMSIIFMKIYDEDPKCLGLEEIGEKTIVSAVIKYMWMASGLAITLSSANYMDCQCNFNQIILSRIIQALSRERFQKLFNDVYMRAVGEKIYSLNKYIKFSS
jgi:hypothetical protein